MCSLWRDIRLQYMMPPQKRIGTIGHHFDSSNDSLFKDETTIYDYPYKQKGVKIVFLENQSKAAFLMEVSTSGSPTIVEALIQ